MYDEVIKILERKENKRKKRESSPIVKAFSF